jgi:hypothetical protein
MLQVWTSVAKEKHIHRLYPTQRVLWYILSPAKLGHAIGTIGARLESPVESLLHLRPSIPSN